jgi:hypothetical protein
MSKENITDIAQIICGNCQSRAECNKNDKPCEEVLSDASKLDEAGYSIQENKELTLSIKDYDAIHRMLGKIEGVAFVLDDKFATPILDALEVIDCILAKGGE